MKLRITLYCFLFFISLQLSAQGKKKMLKNQTDIVLQSLLKLDTLFLDEFMNRSKFMDLQAILKKELNYFDERKNKLAARKLLPPKGYLKACTSVQYSMNHLLMVLNRFQDECDLGFIAIDRDIEFEKSMNISFLNAFSDVTQFSMGSKDTSFIHERVVGEKSFYKFNKDYAAYLYKVNTKQFSAINLSHSYQLYQSQRLADLQYELSKFQLFQADLFNCQIKNQECLQLKHQQFLLKSEAMQVNRQLKESLLRLK